MKYLHILILIFISIIVLSCKNDKPETISATAAGTRNVSGEIVVREATQEEKNSLERGIEQIQKVNKKYPAPPTPLNQETFGVISISEEGVFILENGLKIRMSGIKCNPTGISYLRKYFEEDTDRLAYLSEKTTSIGILDSYVWLVDSSLMNDPDMKESIIGPSYSGMNDTVILSNWCEIDRDNPSIYHPRYQALEEISLKNSR